MCYYSNYFSISSGLTNHCAESDGNEFGQAEFQSILTQVGL